MRRARDLAGTWQGTLPMGKGERVVVKIVKDGAGWSGVVYDLDAGIGVCGAGYDADELCRGGSAFCDCVGGGDFHPEG